MSIAGSSALVAAEPLAGPTGDTNDTLDVANSPLAGLATSTIALSGFQAGGSDQFPIAEIAVFDQPAPDPTLTVDVDVVPGDPDSHIAAASRGLAPVAVLSTATFDATTQIARSSLTFGRTGAEDSIRSCTGRDVTADRRADLVCSFRVAQTGLGVGDVQATLRGSTTTGVAVEGTASVTVR